LPASGNDRDFAIEINRNHKDLLRFVINQFEGSCHQSETLMPDPESAGQRLMADKVNLKSSPSQRTSP
jgi:hypothetical protein